ncbi:MAG TPA: hypothetical protein VGE59_03355 [Patescibacteria group bacterium]
MIFIVGPHGAGKTKAAHIIAKYGLASIDLGPTLRKIHRDTASKLSFEEWVTQGEGEYGVNFTDALLVREIAALQGGLLHDGYQGDLLILGSRSYPGIEYICAHTAPMNGFPCRILFIEASIEVMRTRFNAREGKGLSVEKFQKYIQRPSQQGIAGIRPYAHPLWNDGTEQQLELALLEYLRESTHVLPFNEKKFITV